MSGRAQNEGVPRWTLSTSKSGEWDLFLDGEPFAASASGKRSAARAVAALFEDWQEAEAACRKLLERIESKPLREQR